MQTMFVLGRRRRKADGKIILPETNFKICAGERIALAGKNGAGKVLF